MNKENISAIIQTLQTYKRLTSDPENHSSLLMDKTTLLYTATLLDSKNERVLKLCLDIIEDFVLNDDSHQMLLATFGVFEALESLAIRLRGSNMKLSNRATEIVDILRRSAPPAYSTRLRTKGKNLKKPMLMYQLFVPNLNPENRARLDDALVRIRGLVSFVVDLDQQRCTVRLAPKLAIKSVVERVFEKCRIRCLVVTKNPVDFSEVVDLFVTEMKKDSLFEQFYERVFYGGSFYDGLRVGEPSEFDLDLLLRIPERISATIDVTNIPGFVNCKIVNKSLITNRTFLNMINNEGYIEATSVRAWMESITTKALKILCPKGQLTVLSHTFTVTTRKSGPAMTIILLNKPELSLDIDFIPCFVFRKNEWPKGGYRPNPIPDKPEFFIVPKTPKRPNLPTKTELLWRLSFQEQERKMMEGKQFLKPALRLLKRLRDKEGHNAIASYYIKTVFLWQVEEDDAIFKSSLAECFNAMLEKYIEWLKEGEIPYFWNQKNDLLVGVKSSTLENYANRLRRMRAFGITAYM